MSPVPVSAFVAPFPLVYSQQRRRTLRRGGVGVLSLAAVGLLAACVPAGYANYSPAAGRPATPSEALTVATAVHSSPLTAGAGTRPYQVEAIRLSTGTPGYAFATIDPASQQLDGAAVALRATPDAGGHLTWRVFDIGSRHVGCSAPLAVRSEFALHC
jgi:hypothetical protein